MGLLWGICIAGMFKKSQMFPYTVYSHCHVAHGHNEEAALIQWKNWGMSLGRLYLKEVLEDSKEEDEGKRNRTKTKEGNLCKAYSIWSLKTGAHWAIVDMILPSERHFC